MDASGVKIAVGGNYNVDTTTSILIISTDSGNTWTAPSLGTVYSSTGATTYIGSTHAGGAALPYTSIKYNYTGSILLVSYAYKNQIFGGQDITFLYMSRDNGMNFTDISPTNSRLYRYPRSTLQHIHIDAEGRYIFSAGINYKYIGDISNNTCTYTNIYYYLGNSIPGGVVCGDIYGSRYIVYNLPFENGPFGIYTINRTNVYIQ